jgi:hypothetical protein
VVPDAAVFHALFDVPLDFKKKQIKMETTEFLDKVGGRIVAKGPWSHTFSMTGENATIKWNKEDLTYTVTGVYS